MMGLWTHLWKLIGPAESMLTAPLLSIFTLFGVKWQGWCKYLQCLRVKMVGQSSWSFKGVAVIISLKPKLDKFELDQKKYNNELTRILLFLETLSSVLSSWLSIVNKYNLFLGDFSLELGWKTFKVQLQGKLGKQALSGALFGFLGFSISSQILPY